MRQGDSYLEFKVTKALPIEEIRCTLTELVHEPTGAHVMQIGNDDPENLFCLSLRTWPKSSNGISHILEHTVLCGSKKFPVSDPFFSMNRRSLNTFMNAMTGADFTCYPAASQVPKDFYNLLEVYIDAVFHPLLNRLSFMQEGWRYGFEREGDPSSPLQYQGIVFNEMKGALSSPIERLQELMNRELYPSLIYRHNSGGDPAEIPKLTYEEFLEFHRSYYHPSRCLFFFYGNLPLEGHLDFLAEHALKGVQKAPLESLLPQETRLTRPRYASASYPASGREADPEKNSYLSFGWLTCPLVDQAELLALAILDIILMDTDASPLRLALLKSGLCSRAHSHLEEENSEVPYIITLQGCSHESADQLEHLLFETLRSLAKEGIPRERIESALHQVQLARSEIGGSNYPYGLLLFFRTALAWQHGGKPEHSLMIHSLFTDFEERLEKEPRYLEQLIEKWLIENSHRIRLLLKPDEKLGQKEREAEELHLERVKASLSDLQKQEICRQAKELEAFQKKEESEQLDILPKVSLSDIPLEAKDYPLQRHDSSGLTVYHHDCFTNQLVYANLAFELPRLNARQLALLPLFSLLAPQVGCGGRDYLETLYFQEKYTGGVSLSCQLNPHVEDPSRLSPTLHLRGKALASRGKELFSLLREMAESLDFRNRERVLEVVQKHHTALQASLSKNALKYAINLAASGLNAPAALANLWAGLDYYRLIETLAEGGEAAINPLIDELEELKEQLLCLRGPQLILSCSEESFQALEAHSFYSLSELPQKSYAAWRTELLPEKVSPQGRMIPSPVAFTAKVLPSLPYAHPDSPALSLAGFIFDNVTLHPRIRERGGAYGSGAVHNALSALFSFYAFRDPHIASSLEAFEEAVEKTAEKGVDPERLEEAKLEMVQSLDAPLPPSERADAAYSWKREGRTKALRQLFRERLLAASEEEVREAVRKHLLPLHKQAAAVVFSSKQLLEQENALLKQRGREPLELQLLM